MSISGRPEIEGGVSKDEGEKNTQERASSPFETRATHAPQDEGEEKTFFTQSARS